MIQKCRRNSNKVTRFEVNITCFVRKILMFQVHYLKILPSCNSAVVLPDYLKCTYYLLLPGQLTHKESSTKYKYKYLTAGIPCYGIFFFFSAVGASFSSYVIAHQQPKSLYNSLPPASYAVPSSVFFFSSFSSFQFPLSSLIFLSFSFFHLCNFHCVHLLGHSNINIAKPLQSCHPLL